MPKDLFSAQAKSYAVYRPTYPPALFQYILSFVEEKEMVWDCATGNGQAAVPLSRYFRQVKATDISQAQLNEAPLTTNIEYILCPAEATPFREATFDLITVAQAYHWLDWEKFRQEAGRVGKQNCVVAVWMYDIIQSGDEDLNSCLQHIYKNITGPFWDKERRHVDEHYKSVVFNFAPLPSKDFSIEVEFFKEQLLGYFSSWSAVQNYTRARGHSPILLIKESIDSTWKNESSQPFSFPVYLRIGRVEKVGS